MSSLPVRYDWSEFPCAVALEVDGSRLRCFGIRRKDTSIACARYDAAHRSSDAAGLAAGFTAPILVKSVSSPAAFYRGPDAASETIIARACGSAFIGRYAEAGSADSMDKSGVLWLEGRILTGRLLVTINADVVALARLIRYSEQEALRLGVPGVVVECLRMAAIELTNTIEKERSGECAEAARVN